MLTIPGGRLATDAYVLIGEAPDIPESMLSLYAVSPVSTELSGPVSLSLFYGNGGWEPAHLCVARVDAGEAYPLDSYLDREQGRLVAYVDRLGAFGLLERPDIDTPAYRGGDLTIFQNAPNPFSKSTEIRFAVPEMQPVLVRVFSVEGRLVRELLNSTLVPGRHGVKWDGTDQAGTRLAGGVYFCRVTTPSATATGKMVLLH